MLDRFVESKIVSSGTSFRPNDPITRAEAAILLTRAKGLAPLDGRPHFSDVRQKDPRSATLNAFAKALKLKKFTKFRPDATLTRGEFAKMLDTWVSKVGK